MPKNTSRKVKLYDYCKQNGKHLIGPKSNPHFSLPQLSGSMINYGISTTWPLQIPEFTIQPNNYAHWYQTDIRPTKWCFTNSHWVGDHCNQSYEAYCAVNQTLTANQTQEHIQCHIKMVLLNTQTFYGEQGFATRMSFNMKHTKMSKWPLWF